MLDRAQPGLPRLVDPDDASTWPADVEAIVRERAETGQYDGTVPHPLESSQVIDALDGAPVLAYHASRLLPHEVTAVRTGGLRPLDTPLVETKLNEAAAAGAISTQQRQALHADSMGNDANRRGQVWMFLGTHVLLAEPHGVRPLLRTWGGEAINFTHAGNAAPELADIGTPCIVQVALPLTATSDVSIWPSLAAVFVGTLLGQPTTADCMWREGPIAAGQILDIFSPGDAWYHQFPGLPAN